LRSRSIITSAIKLPVALLDDCSVAGLVLLDYGASAISVTVVAAIRPTRSAIVPTDPAL
jgi:hypothetical protein